MTDTLQDVRRLDQLLVAAGHFTSRARAQGAIRAGLVRVDGETTIKPSANIGPSAVVIVDGDLHDYVSRGGVKLEAALKAFNIDAVGKICLDLGASTGGFTDVLLRTGAAKVYAVDVGAGQLHLSLATDRRIVALEKTHAKNLTRALICDEIELLVCDVSFISLYKVLPPALALCRESARVITLVKPQFELGPEKIGKGGLVKADADELAKMIDSLKQWFADRAWRVDGVIDSPITGGDGNQEYLLAASR